MTYRKLLRGLNVRDFLKYLWLLYLYFLFFERQNQILLFEEK